MDKQESWIYPQKKTPTEFTVYYNLFDVVSRAIENIQMQVSSSYQPFFHFLVFFFLTWPVQSGGIDCIHMQSNMAYSQSHHQVFPFEAASFGSSGLQPKVSAVTRAILRLVSCSKDYSARPGGDIQMYQSGWVLGQLI